MESYAEREVTAGEDLKYSKLHYIKGECFYKRKKEVQEQSIKHPPIKPTCINGCQQPTPAFRKCK